MTTRATTLLLLLFVGCDTGHADRAKVDGINEAAQSCLQQMAECTDWKPVLLEPAIERPQDEDCHKRYDQSEWSLQECVERNDRRRDTYLKSLEKPVHQSPCQQRAATCVEMLRAMKGAPQTKTITHHHK